MRVIAVILLGLLFPSVVCGSQSAPAWHIVDKKEIQFFKENGFQFVVDDSMAHHYAKPTVEISILIPERFIDLDHTNTFSSVAILSDELSTDLGTHEQTGMKRVILTVSEAMSQKSEVVFYFRNNRKGVTHGSMYRLNLAKVVDEWRKGKK